MKDKICLITGTASGMGRIAAKSLAEKGTTLILVDFDTENGVAARDEIIEATGNKSIEYIDCDVSSFSELHRLSDYIHEHYSRVDVLINNAGITESMRRENEDGFEMTLATNFLGPLCSIYSKLQRHQGLLIFLQMLIGWLRNLILMTSTIENAGIKSIMEPDSKLMRVQKLV